MDADRYTITFRDTGEFSAQADCNRLLGGWSIEDTSVSLTPGPTTLAACPPDSRSDDFITWLTQVTSAQLDNDGGLMLTSGDGDDLTLLQFEPAE
jgi:heat shock protein HslJ